MTNAAIVASLPLLIISATAVILMLAIAVRRSHFAAVAISLAGLAVALLSLLLAPAGGSHEVGSFLILDSYAVLYMAILLAAAGFVFLFAYDYLERRQEHREEFYLLVLLATTGSMVLAASRNFASFFLGLELLSVALYALIAYLRHERACIEAGIKYLVLAASSSSVLLFGLALIYSETGSMDLAQFAAPSGSAPGTSVVLLAGTMLALVGIGFKLAVVPFHMWTPDVYEGAPLPVTAFVATVSKGGMFALVLRWFHPAASGGLGGATGAVLTVIAIASMLSGNLLALRQMNVKRILAYSSIAHMGYLLVSLLAGGALGLAAGTYYLIAYLVTILGAFGTMTALSGARREAASIESYRGLFWERPVVAGVFTTMLLSLAGIPLTAGFLGKFYVLTAGAAQSRWILLFTLVLSSTIGLYYYLRIVVAMIAQPHDSVTISGADTIRVPLAAAVALAALTGLVFLLGVYPSVLWNIIVDATRSLG